MDKKEKKAIKQERRAKFKSLSFKEKLEYLADYYLMGTLITLVLLGATISILYTIFFNKQEKVLSIELVDCQIEEHDKLEKALNDLLGVDGKKKKATVSANNIMYDADGVDPEIYESVNTMFYVGGLDVYIGTKRDIPIYAKNNYFQDLSELIDSELFKKLEEKDMLYYYKQSVVDDEGVEYSLSKPVGIIISDTAFAKEYKVYSDGPIVCVSATSLHKADVLKFIDYMLRESF